MLPFLSTLLRKMYDFFSFCGSHSNYKYNFCKSIRFFHFRPFFRKLSYPPFCFWKRRWLNSGPYTVNVCGSTKLNFFVNNLRGLMNPESSKWSIIASSSKSSDKITLISNPLHQTTPLRISDPILTEIFRQRFAS